jgi:hypothetical protein
MIRRGVALDVTLTESAALLHDLDKALPAGDLYRVLGHGAGGAAWLRDRGYGELAGLVEPHPVYVLGNAENYDAWAAGTGLEARIVAYADKRALQDLVSLDDRFARWYTRYPDSAMLPVAHERARRLEREICAAAGLEPGEVGRLAWVADAVRSAA